MRGPVMALALAAAIAGGVVSAQACSCIRETREQVVARVAVLFDGEVTEVRPVRDGRGLVGVVAVRQILKGAPPRVVHVETTANSTMCGWPMAVGDRRTFGGVWGSDGRLHTDMCIMAPLQPRR